jgi:hypothetical protein
MRAIWPDCERTARHAGRDGGPGPEDGRRLFGVLMSREPSGGRMPEDRLCRMLAEAGRAMGVRVIVFAPEGVREERGGTPFGCKTDGGYGTAVGRGTERRTGADRAGAMARGRAAVRGWMLEGGVWTPAAAPVPKVYFDRRFPRTPAELAAGARAVRILRRHGAAPLGRALPGKAQVHAALGRSPRLAPLLPPTALLAPRRLAVLLAAHPAGLFLKPAAGMQGRGAAALRPEPGGGIVRITGRTMQGRSFEARVPADRLAEAALKLTRGRPYLVQPLLPLRTAADEPFDLRLFAQKDRGGRWTVTGAAVRLGRPGAAASNLHGGGSARPAIAFLAAMLGEQAAARLLDRAKRAALLAAREAERAFGRLAEIGADFGVEPDGRLWLLELNGKPGRAIFAEIGDAEGERLAAERTISYGLRLMAAGAPVRRAAGRPQAAERRRMRRMNGTTAHSTADTREVPS